MTPTETPAVEVETKVDRITTVKFLCTTRDSAERTARDAMSNPRNNKVWFTNQTWMKEGEAGKYEVIVEYK